MLTTLLRPPRSPSVSTCGAADSLIVSHPCLGAVLRSLVAKMSVACVIPALLFYVALVNLNLAAALVAALTWSYGAIAWRWSTKRAPSGLLVLTAILMTARTAVALATGNTFIYFFQPVLSDGAIATVFLLSLLTARPLVARLAGDFYPMTQDVAQRPRIQRLLWRLTLLWGLVVLAKGFVVFWLLQSQPLVTFVLVKNLTLICMTMLATTVTVIAATRVARGEGLLTPST